MPAEIYDGRVWLTNCEGDGDLTFYGGEELYMARKVRAEGRKIAYFRNVFCEHLGAEDRTPGYQLWKFSHGLMRWTRLDLEPWRSSGEMLRDVRRILDLWLSPPNRGWAGQYVVDAVRWMAELGNEQDVKILLYVAHGGWGVRSPVCSPEVLLVCKAAAERIQERLK
jgi:hypothetical protein